MADRCPEFDRHSSEARPWDPIQEAEWTRHLQTCASCREQDFVDQVVREVLGGLPRPKLAPSFARSCSNRARRARRR